MKSPALEFDALAAVISALPEDAERLDSLAWPLVDPERTSFGREDEGLALALRARELADGNDELAAVTGNTVAWALFALGRDDEAAVPATEPHSAPERQAPDGATPPPPIVVAVDDDNRALAN